MKFIFTIIAVWFALFVSVTVHMSVELQLAVMLATIFFLYASVASLFVLVIYWRKSKRQAVMPLLCVVFAILFSPWLGRTLRSGLFEYRMPRYEAVVKRLSNEMVLATKESIEIKLSDTEQDLAYFVLAQRNGDGTFIVEFTNGSGFPVQHSGYLYSSSGIIADNSFFRQRWPNIKMIQSKWFRVSD